MSFRFIPSRGNVFQTPNIINVFASGTIQRGSVVEFSALKNQVIPASANTTYTNIFGISLDYAPDNSGAQTQVRVIPFASGQLWEADVTNTPATSQIFLKHALSNNVTINNSATDVNGPTGIFLAHTLTTIIANTLVGEFIRAQISQR